MTTFGKKLVWIVFILFFLAPHEQRFRVTVVGTFTLV